MTRNREIDLLDLIECDHKPEVPVSEDGEILYWLCRCGRQVKAKIHAPRGGEKMRLARMMTDAEIASELESLGKKWDAFRVPRQ